MPNLVNRLAVRELSADFKSAEGLILVSYGGLTAEQNEGLRDKLAEKGCKMRVVRNSLARLVFAERGVELGANVLTGNVAMAFGSSEAVLHAAKMFSSPETKKIGKVEARAGMLEGRLLLAADLAALANVPDRNTLRAQLLGLLSGPARGLVRSLDGLNSGFARVLQARADQLQASEASQASEAPPAPQGA